jgi:hypothetical protein
VTLPLELTVTFAPFGPADTLTPALLTLSETPFAILMRLKNLNPKSPSYDYY